MKRMFTIALLAVLLMPGCQYLVMTAELNSLLDHTTVLSEETALRAAGAHPVQPKLSEAEMVSALQSQARVWRIFKDMKDGVVRKAVEVVDR